ncbi:MAG: thioredoxin family protein [Desulfobacterales bacterium]|nr:thioredoxin family protein [Desulfobacterales bacterium]
MTTETLRKESGFDPLIAEGVCLAYFNTPWSAPCRAQISILDRLDHLYGNRLKLVNVNIDHLERLRTRFGVHNIPTMILFNKGMECKRLVGVHPEADLCTVIDEELKRA